MRRRQFLTSSLGGVLAARRAEANEKIDQARQAALSILKPTNAQLEHGLELHRNSIVFESYGFSPNSAVDGSRIKAEMEAGASEIELQDLREEMAMTRHVADAAEREEYKAAWKASGVTAVFQNAGEEGSDPLRLVKRLARFTYVTDRMRDFVTKAVEPDDVLAAKKAGRHCLYFSGNGVPITQNWVSVADELRYVRVFFQLGIRMMHLTYNRRNAVGDGCAEPANAGLSEFGRAVVQEMNRVGVIVDVAHSGWQTSLDAAKCSQRPMVASHSCCAALNRHIRSKPDEVIRAIVDTGGYIGICAIPSFLGRSEDIAAMLDHIDYVVKRFGADHVTIGTDVAYVSRNAAKENQMIPRRPRARTGWESLWPPGSLVDRPAGSLTMAWTNWPLFTVGMVERGYRDSDIQKILGGNVLRVARAVLAPGSL